MLIDAVNDVKSHHHMSFMVGVTGRACGGNGKSLHGQTKDLEKELGFATYFLLALQSQPPSRREFHEI